MGPQAVLVAGRLNACIWDFVVLMLVLNDCILECVSLYGKPPCQDGEIYASLFGRVLCTSKCAARGECPVGKPEGTFADPKCVIEVDLDDDGGKGKAAKPT